MLHAGRESDHVDSPTEPSGLLVYLNHTRQTRKVLATKPLHLHRKTNSKFNQRGINLDSFHLRELTVERRESMRSAKRKCAWPCHAAFIQNSDLRKLLLLR
jgi:hypothetical protein